MPSGDTVVSVDCLVLITRRWSRNAGEKVEVTGDFANDVLEDVTKVLRHSEEWVRFGAEQSHTSCESQY